MRLIDADVLLKYAGNCYDEDDHLLYAVGTGTIMRIPTIDAVQVVRCKDCRYNYANAEGREYNPNDIVCTYFDTDGMDASDFCSYGERRSDDDMR